MHTETRHQAIARAQAADQAAEKGQIAQALELIQQAIDLWPDQEDLYSKQLFWLLAHPEADAAKTQPYFEAYAQRAHAEPFPEHPNQKSAGRKLKVGYVCGDFKFHALARVITPLFRFHDPRQFEVHCFSNVDSPDQMTKWFQEHCLHWHDITRLTDLQACELIRQQPIDLLVDLAGHSKGHRLGIFAHKPAPLQLTAGLGLIATTGLNSIDYRLADQMLIPDSLLPFQRETTLYLSQHMHWDPPEVLHQLPLEPLPYHSNGYITFGSANRSYKLNERVIACWSEILRQLPTSRLSLKCHSFDKPEIRAHFTSAFEAQGIAAERLIFVGSTDTPQHVRHFASYDIALDPFPYQGGLTTFEALFMGVPVIALDFPGGSRASASILNAVGCRELLAPHPGAYVQLAVSLAQQLPVLEQMRKGLRQRLLRSAAFDGLLYTRELENAYRWAWQQWCNDQQPDSQFVIPAQCPQAELWGTVPESQQQEWLHQARLSFEQERYEMAEALCQELLALPPDTAGIRAEASHLLGLIALRYGQAAAAQQLLEQAVELQPESSYFWVNLGQVYRELGLTDKAESAYTRALELEPELRETLRQQGILALSNLEPQA